MDDRPLFEVVTPAASAAARRLVTAAYVGATMETPPADAVLESYIDEVSARAAEFCRLAKDAIGTPPTFAAEALRATWFGTSATRGPRLLAVASAGDVDHLRGRGWCDPHRE